MDATICPKCNGEVTFCLNDFIEHALEVRECEACGCKYEVVYEMKVKEVNIIT